jgi:hypothetical protein
MGYDAFGLPAEQYAIQTGQHPALTTDINIKRYREQLDKLGLATTGIARYVPATPNTITGPNGLSSKCLSIGITTKHKS